MIDNNCIFCKIAAGIIPSATVYEDDDFRAILDIAPAAKGHILLLPKRHMPDIFGIEEETAKKALGVVSRLASAMKEALSCDGVNVLQNNGTAGWQSVFHLHIHIIPRFENDNISFPWKTLAYDEAEAEEYAKKIKRVL